MNKQKTCLNNIFGWMDGVVQHFGEISLFSFLVEDKMRSSTTVNVKRLLYSSQHKDWTRVEPVFGLVW